ncbi:DUF58 domain-containing protein [Marilutibacter alkalisoli]|uniref:DUF58 domain-containing protein n=1 Tax=Marilutibacter alkalisoli TaxID=2591633 RepID=A0A514BP70_9GAMM|nr:DUF58 domain-containing protein [Lysobacter alkalisoli]QDH69176.1 DUF58 domain-containing protein [Lysobacter alkalisoli]
MSAPADNGIEPTLAELVALRGSATGRHRARKGRFGGSGHALSPLRGRGMEYAESREYVAGDDARHIDWRLTARTGRAHTKLYQAERERLTLIVGDTRPSLYFGTRVRFKSVQAARVGAIAAWAAARDGDRIAALRGSVSEPPVTPASGTRGVLRVLDALVRWYRHAPADDAGLAVALEHAERLLRPGSRLVVLADPASVAAIPERRWPVLAQHHEVIVLLLTDPLETDPPRALLPFRAGVEGARQGDSRLELDLGSAALRSRWNQAFKVPVEAALERLPARGVRAMALSSDGDSDAWLPLLGRARPLVA